jgi:small multidrug resistance family-3 protein
VTVAHSAVLFVLAALAEIRDGFRPDRYDIIGAAICLLSVAVIMYALRATLRTMT